MLQTTAIRRHLTRWLIAFALAVPLTTVYASRTAVTALSAAGPVGATLSVLASPVEVASADPGAFAPAIDGQTLFKGDRIRTGPSGMALLTFFDGSESQLDSGSQVEIEQMDASPAPQIAFLQTAGVTVNHVIPMPAQGSFRTDTQAATGLVRGTSYVVIVGPAGTCGLSGDQPCVASVILLTDRNGHVGRVDVTANDSNAPAVQLSAAGAAVAATSRRATAVQVDPAVLAQLEAVAHVRNNPAAFLATEQDVRAIAATLEPLVGSVTPPNSTAPMGLPPVTPATISPPLADAAYVVTQAPAPASSPQTQTQTQTPAEPNAPTPAAARTDHPVQSNSTSVQSSSGSAESSSGSAESSSGSVPGSSSAGHGNAAAAHSVSVSGPPAVTAPASTVTSASPPAHGDLQPPRPAKAAPPTDVTKTAAVVATSNAASTANSPPASSPGKSDTPKKSTDPANPASPGKSTQADKSNASGKPDKPTKSDG